MPTARVELNFELGGGVYVARELLGQVLTVDRDGENVAIEFPSGPADFPAGRGRDKLPAIWGASRGTVDDPDQLVTVRVLRVVIMGQLSFAPTTYRSEDREQLDEAVRLFRHAHELGSSAIQDLRDWIRVVRRQPWLGVTGEPVEITGLQQLFDEETGERYRIGFPYTLHGYLRDDESALQPGDMAQVEASLSGRARPGLADLLLADAAAVLGAGQQDPLRAIVLLAIAVEVNVKATVRALATAEQLPLVDVVLEKPADVSVSVVSLLDVGLAAVIGRSLKTENKRLHAQTRALMNRRNSAVHRGEAPDLADVRGDLEAARSLFAWLTSLARPD